VRTSIAEVRTASDQARRAEPQEPR
jgi:hypothetical protein